MLSYFYYACFTLCLVAALFVLTVSTVANVFGPTMALKGSTDDSVKMAANKMMSVQIQVLQVAAISISALFLGACLLSESVSCAVGYHRHYHHHPSGIGVCCVRLVQLSAGHRNDLHGLLHRDLLLPHIRGVQGSIPAGQDEHSISPSLVLCRPTAPSSRTKMLSWTWTRTRPAAASPTVRAW